MKNHTKPVQKEKTEKPWAKLRISRKHYMATKPWKGAGLSRKKFEEVLELAPEDCISELWDLAHAEHLMKAMGFAED